MRHQIAMRAVDVNAGEAGLFDDTRRCRELSDRVLDLVIGHRSSVIGHRPSRDSSPGSIRPFGAMGSR